MQSFILKYFYARKLCFGYGLGKKLYLMKIFTENTQFYEYLGMGIGIDTQFLG